MPLIQLVRLEHALNVNRTNTAIQTALNELLAGRQVGTQIGELRNNLSDQFDTLSKENLKGVPGLKILNQMELLLNDYNYNIAKTNNRVNFALELGGMKPNLTLAPSLGYLDSANIDLLGRSQRMVTANQYNDITSLINLKKLFTPTTTTTPPSTGGSESTTTTSPSNGKEKSWFAKNPIYTTGIIGAGGLAAGGAMIMNNNN